MLQPHHRLPSSSSRKTSGVPPGSAVINGLPLASLVPLSVTSNTLMTRGLAAASTMYIFDSSGENARPLGRFTSPATTVAFPVRASTR